MARLWLLGVVIVASGCSPFLGSPRVGTDAAREEPRLSRAELVLRANGVCARRTRALTDLRRPRTRAQARRFFARVAAIERAEAVALAGLRPPRSQEAQFVGLLGASVELAQVAGRFHSALVRDDVHARRRALAAADRLSNEYDRAARKLGFACRQTA